MLIEHRFQLDARPKHIVCHLIKIKRSNISKCVDTPKVFNSNFASRIKFYDKLNFMELLIVISILYSSNLPLRTLDLSRSIALQIMIADANPFALTDYLFSIMRTALQTSPPRSHCPVIQRFYFRINTGLK